MCPEPARLAGDRGVGRDNHDVVDAAASRQLEDQVEEEGFGDAIAAPPGRAARPAARWRPTAPSPGRLRSCANCRTRTRLVRLPGRARHLLRSLRVYFSRLRLDANSRVRLRQASPAVPALHQRRADSSPRCLRGGRIGVLGVADHPVDQPLVERGDARGRRRTADGPHEEIGRALDDLAGHVGADGDDRAREQPPSPRARPASRGSARSRSRDWRARSRSPRPTRSPRAPRAWERHRRCPRSRTSSTSAWACSATRYRCRPRQPSAVLTWVRTGSSHIGRTARVGPERPRDLGLCVGAAAALGDELAPVQAGREVAVGEAEPVGRPEPDQAVEDGERVVLDSPAALLVDLAGQPVGDQVRIRGDVDPRDLDVVGAVGDHRETGAEEVLHAGGELRPAGASGEDDAALDSAHGQARPRPSGRPRAGR